MQELELLLLTAVTSLIVLVVTSVITLKITQRNDVKKHILEKRTEFYLDVFPLIDLIINEYNSVFDFEYMENFIDTKSEMKLLASDKTFEQYEKLFRYMTDNYNKYCVYYNLKEADTSINSKKFEELMHEYMDKNPLNRDYLQELVLNLYQEMRKDLGSNIK